ncbi:hypothetical protein LXL04_007668 [Taraxacum kok-saghyz]
MSIVFSVTAGVISHPKSLEFLLPLNGFKSRSQNSHILNPFCQRIKDKADYAKKVMCLANAIDRLQISDSQTNDTTGEELSPELSNRYIRGLCKAGNIDRAMVYLSQMEALGFRLSYASYTCLLTTLVSVGRTLEVEAIYQEMVISGFQPRLEVYNLLLKGFLRKGLLTLADKVVESMNDMGVWKNRETYEILLGYYVSAGRLKDTWEVVAKMRKDGFEPNSFVYSMIIKLYRDNGMWKKAINLIAEVREYGISVDRNIFNTIIDTFGKAGELRDALQVFDKMQQEGITPDITTWNSLIRWHCKHGDLTNALVLFNEMQTQGLYPDPSIFITIISRLGEQGKWDIIRKNFEHMKHEGHGQSGTMYAVLVDIYGQYGRFEDAEGLCEQTVKVLQLMEHEGMEPNLIMLNVLINAFGIAGRHLEALSVYHHIKESGVSPDVVTYTTLMKALLRAKEFKKVPVIYRDMETARCSPDRKARELLQIAMMGYCCICNELENKALNLFVSRCEGMRPQVEDVPELMQLIQSQLPVIEAARMSVLSKSWLHAWSTIPILRLDLRSRKKMKLEDVNRVLIRTRLLLPPATNVEELCFLTDCDECQWERSPFFDALFEVCHPKIVISIPDLYFEHNNHFCRLMLREVLQKKKTTTAHWSHYLNHVQTREHPHQKWKTPTTSKQ